MRVLSNQKAFTLLEVIAAITIFAFGVLALSRIQMSSVTSNSLANEISQATKIAQEQIETLMALPYTDAQLNDTDNDGTGQDGNSDGVDDDGGDFGLGHTGAQADYHPVDLRLKRYTVCWNVAVNQPITSTKTIRVVVQWTGRKNTAHSVSMECVKGTHY